MADTHETIADIIAEMRGMGNYQRYSGDHARVLANRLEAAHKREVQNALDAGGFVEASRKNKQVGNAAKLREAIAKCVNLITEFGNAEIVKTPLDVIIDIEAILKDALAAPPRNCDVGTAEEQAKRMDAYCTSYRERIGGSWRCDNCPLCSIHRCELAWAQMPYEEGGAE